MAVAQRDHPRDSRAALKVLRLEPVVVRGANFRALETVRVTAITTADTYVERVRASGTGTFTLTFDRIELARRGGCRVDLVLHARGSLGSRATFKPANALCGSLGGGR